MISKRSCESGEVVSSSFPAEFIVRVALFAVELENPKSKFVEVVLIEFEYEVSEQEHQLRL